MNLHAHNFSAKSLSIFAALFFTFFTLKIASAQTCSGNLLDNPGFEAGLTSWSVSGAIDISSDAHSGSNAIEMPPDGLDTRVYQLFPAVPGEKYEFSAYFKGRNGALGLKFLTADWQPNGQLSGISSPNSYGRRSIDRVAPANTAWVEVSLYPGSTGAVLADDACLTIVGSSSSCQITPTITQSACNSNQTPNDPSDDTYRITINTINPGNNSNFQGYRLVNQQTNYIHTINYGQDFSFVNSISNGAVALTLIDDDDLNCTTVITTPQPPNTCSGGTGGNGGDLKLTATGAPANIAAWQFGNSTFTITNEGTQSVSGIQVSFDLHASAKLKGGDEYDASQGTLQSFWTQTPIWQVGSLAPGQTETIQLNIFTLAGGMMPIYGQVSAASGNDPDSSPNNGNAPTPNEDDEAVFTFNGSGNPTQQPDLQMSNLSISNQPSAGEVLNYNFNVINGGNITASGNYNIKAYISTDNVLSNDDIQDGIVPTGNTPVGTIPAVPGASTLPGNLSQGSYYLILKIDADNQITESNEGNNTISAPFTIGGANNLPDLIIRDVVSTAQQVFIGQGVQVTFEGANLGDTVPFSSFPLIYALYMSTDQVLDANDAFILDLGLGRGPGLQFGGQVPPNLAPGDYYLIVQTDFPNNIQESNEGNNWTASTQTVEAVRVGNTCAFTKRFDPLNGFDAPSLRGDYTLVESGSGYSLNYLNFDFPTQTLFDGAIELDLNGNLLSQTETPNNDTSPYDVSLENNATLGIIDMTFNQSPDLPNGTVVQLNLNYSNPTAVLLPDSPSKISTGGYAFAIGIVDQTLSPNILNFIIKTDNFGQNVEIFNLPNPDFYYGSGVSEGPAGLIYATFTASGNYSVYGVPAGGTSAWHYRVAGDTPSTTWVDTKVSHDGQFVYTAKTDNLQAFIAKIRASDGMVTDIDLSDFKTPSPGGSYRRTFVRGIETTSDGGLLVSIGFDEVSGNLEGEILAKFDANGNLLWEQEFTPGTFVVQPVGETSDGGALFVGNTGNGFFNTGDEDAIFLKTAANGALVPYCDGGTSNDGVDLELSFAPLSDPDPAQWGFFGTTLTVTNNGTEAASGVQVQFNKADEVTYKGGDEFTASQGNFQYWGNEIWTVGNLAAGQSATLTVNYFRLSANPFTAFAQVSEMNESDADSTPGNGTCCNASEDDEASVAVGSGAANAVGNRTLLEDNIGEQEGFAILNAAPNPFSDNLNLNVFSKESRSSELMIFDVLGRPVLRKAVDLTEGHNEISIDATELPSGFLIVKMSPDHKYLRQVRVMKLRD